MFAKTFGMTVSELVRLASKNGRATFPDASMSAAQQIRHVAGPTPKLPSFFRT